MSQAGRFERIGMFPAHNPLADPQDYSNAEVPSRRYPLPPSEPLLLHKRRKEPNHSNFLNKILQLPVYLVHEDHTPCFMFFDGQPHFSSLNGVGLFYYYYY